MQANVLRSIHKTLDQEKQALLGADYAALTSLISQKEQLLSQISNMKTRRADMVAIKAKIDHNQSLLTAAIDGVGAAQNRLSALLDVQQTLCVYDPSGKIEIVPNKAGVIEKKA